MLLQSFYLICKSRVLMTIYFSFVDLDYINFAMEEKRKEVR